MDECTGESSSKAAKAIKSSACAPAELGRGVIKPSAEAACRVGVAMARSRAAYGHAYSIRECTQPYTTFTHHVSMIGFQPMPTWQGNPTTYTVTADYHQAQLSSA